MIQEVTGVEAACDEEIGDPQSIEVVDAEGDDGWGAVWLARTAPPRRRKAMIVGAACVVSAVIASLAFSSGGSSPHKAASKASPLASTAGQPSALNGATGSGGFTPAQSATGSGNGAGNLSLGSPGLAPAAAPGLPNEVPSFSAKVVKTGTLQIEVPTGNIEGTVRLLAFDAGGLGGFVASSNESSGSSASGNMTLRVPELKYDYLVKDAQGLGKTLQLSSTGTDVTAQYVDLQARIDSLQATRTQFEQILAKAQAIGDILSVESQISDVQTQIEQLQGQFQVLNDQATYSTLTVQISEVGKPPPAPPKPPSGISKAWSHAGHSFAHGAEAILGATGGIAIFLITLAALLLIGRLIWAGLRRRAA